MSYYQETSFSTSEVQGLSSGRISYEMISAGSNGSAGFALSGSSFAGANQGTVSSIANDLLQFSRTGGASSSAAALSSTGASVPVIGALQYTSEIESAIIRATTPININETEEITVLGNRGVWANRTEVVNWKGIIPIEQYLINEDANPEVITKRVRQQLEYVQELAIRYLRPPTPPAPGEIVIQMEANSLTPPAPPLVIRQIPARPETPQPLVLREAPPQPPQPVGRKLITIGGKRLPPPPRKVVIERLAPLPSKPQAVIIERWLPYVQGKRRVIFQKSNAVDPVIVKPRNVIVQWEAPSVIIKKDYKYLGVIRANPAEYVSRFGSSLKLSRELPQFVLDIKTPDGLVLAADHKYSSFYELEGDVSALNLIDLDREGLSEYRSFLQRISTVSSASGSFSTSGSVSSSVIIEEVFKSIDLNSNGKIGFDEAEKILLKLNSRLGRSYGENEVRIFFRTLDTNNDGSIDLEEFKKAFINSI